MPKFEKIKEVELLCNKLSSLGKIDSQFFENFVHDAIHRCRTLAETSQREADDLRNQLNSRIGAIHQARMMESVFVNMLEAYVTGLENDNKSAKVKPIRGKKPE